jgi:hypothetical protein
MMINESAGYNQLINKLPIAIADYTTAVFQSVLRASVKR